MERKGRKTKIIARQLELPLDFAGGRKIKGDNVVNLLEFISLRTNDLEQAERERIYKELAEAAKKLPW